MTPGIPKGRGRRLAGLSGVLALLAACGRAPAGVVRVSPDVQLLDRMATDASNQSAFEGVTRNEFFVLRTDAELERLKKRLGLPGLLGGQPLGARHEMIVGAIGEPMRRYRDFVLFRVLFTPDAVEVHVVSFPRQEVERPLTPYVFARVPRSEKPVRFYLNDRPAAGDDLRSLPPGLHDRLITYRTHYAVNVPEHLDTPAPLLVFLHSSTSNAHRWSPGFSGWAEKYGFVVLTPTSRNGYYWTETYDYPAILDAIEEVKLRYPIDPKRIYAAGNSAGGHTVYHFAITYRDVFSGFVSSAGRLNPEVEDQVLEKGRGMPALILCGERDDKVPLARVLAGKERLEKFGVQVTFRSYPWGHGVLAPETGALEHMFQWLSKLAYGTEEPRPAWLARERARVSAANLP
jgi:hypothetical protein